jgi:DNA-directed RNA polymerase subunit M/transcription elongation factor TFIIS
MLVKCNCNNCSAHLEFDSTNAGTVIACPKCGIETQLYVPAKPASPQSPASSHLTGIDSSFLVSATR